MRAKSKLQWGRDLSVAEGVRLTGKCQNASRRFNGAATFRSRKEGPPAQNVCRGLVLQWGRDLSVAEGTLREYVTELTVELQWGRDLSVAEGPSTAAAAAAARCFNGAATFRSRKDDVRGLHRRHAQRFNGAATFRSRKAGSSRQGSGSGSCFNGAATFRSRKGKVPESILCKVPASMGPRPFGRGRSVKRSPD